MKLKYISWLPAFFMMVIIFYFSSRPVTISNESSVSIAEELLNLYETITDNTLQEDARSSILAATNHYVRKTAHFMEYALLAMTIAFHMSVIRSNKTRLILVSVLLSALYAASDEFHQTMVPGRGGQIRDVILDTAGAVTGTLLFYYAITLIARIRKNKSTATVK